MTQLRELPFTKYSGCGNDFILISGRHIDVDRLVPYVPRLCHRWEGIGADGVLFFEETENADAFVHIFNADGSSAALCANGLRCVVRCLHEELGIQRPVYQLETSGGRYRGIMEKDSTVEVSLGSSVISGPEETPLLPYPFYSLTVGVPHAVVFCPDVADIDVINYGRQLRQSPRFAPEGTNVNFANVIDSTTIAIRTYERGVEGETWACGSGAAATAIAAAYHFDLSSPLKLATRHGSILHYTFELNGRQADNLTMRGPTLRCFRGSYTLTQDYS